MGDLFIYKIFYILYIEEKHILKELHEIKKILIYKKVEKIIFKDLIRLKMGNI